MTSENAPTATVSDARPAGLNRDLLFIAYAAFITTMAQDKVLGSLPIRLLLKNHFSATPTELSAFLFWAGLAWYLKPLFGLVVDAFPLFGTRRRWYMIGSACLAAASWLLLAFAARLCSPHKFLPFLCAAILLGIMMVFASTIMGALLVEVGQRYKATGRVSSAREVVQNACYIITGPIGGFLAGHAFGLTAGIASGLLLSLAGAAYLFLPEQAVAKRNTRVWVDAGQQLKKVFASGTLWAAAGLILLFFFSPGFATPLLYRQQNLLKFDDQFLGTLMMVDGIFLVIGASAYGWVCKKIKLRTLLFWGIVLSGCSSLLYLSYAPSRTGAISIEALAQVMGGLGILPLYDLATRATPKGGEAMGYALMMSARNIAVFGADVFGSWLVDHNFAWNTLVLMNAGTTFVCLVIVLFLPRILTKDRDGQTQSA
jgi:predicted MFS family arabinose efflux permease